MLSTSFRLLMILSTAWCVLFNVFTLLMFSLIRPIVIQKKKKFKTTIFCYIYSVLILLWCIYVYCLFYKP